MSCCESPSASPTSKLVCSPGWAAMSACMWLSVLHFRLLRHCIIRLRRCTNPLDGPFNLFLCDPFGSRSVLMTSVRAMMQNKETSDDSPALLKATGLFWVCLTDTSVKKTLKYLRKEKHIWVKSTKYWENGSRVKPLVPFFVLPPMRKCPLKQYPHGDQHRSQVFSSCCYHKWTPAETHAFFLLRGRRLVPQKLKMIPMNILTLCDLIRNTLTQLFPAKTAAVTYMLKSGHAE